MLQFVQRRLLPLLSLAVAAFFLSVCNAALGLGDFKDCPPDSDCASTSATTSSSTATTTSNTTSTTSSSTAESSSSGPPPASCMDKTKDGNETGTDCGGSCPPCIDGDGCVTGSDCIDKVCTGGACQAASCMDGVKNGTETDVDCGGSCSKLCAEGKGCQTDAECEGMVCMNGTCQPTCTDGVMDGAETDLDCGGPMCPACGLGKMCSSSTDCATGMNGQPTCTSSVCGFACTAGFANCDVGKVGCETDITTKTNCGACNTACSAYCVAGECNDPIALATPGGYHHACAILKDGSVWCWGQNTSGEVGDGTTTLRSSPTKIALPKAATSVSANGSGSSQTCAVLSDASLWCWGDNGYGELGIGDLLQHLGPQKVPLPNVVQVAVGGVHVCALDTSQNVYCWGSNGYGEAGNGVAGGNISKPALVTGSVLKIAAGDEHACAVKTNGSVYCWGQNVSGQLGNDVMTQNANPSPVAVPTVWLNNVSDIFAGEGLTCARDGTVAYCWGFNGVGSLGIGSTMDQGIPQMVPLAGVSQLALAGWHVGAITSAGLFTWGANYDGQLGDGTTMERNSPTMITFPNVATVSVSSSDTYVLTTTHVLSCWGDNTYGQLGNGTTSASFGPVAVVWP